METTMWTYTKKRAAWLDNEIVTIPDEIADDQRHHDEKATAFPALNRRGKQIMVRLDGDAYGLHTPGTGDPVVREIE